MSVARRRIALAGILSPVAGAARAMTNPDDAAALRVVVPQGAGGALDGLARTLAPPLTRALRRPVWIDNRPGGGTVTGTAAVARAAPDGHTIGMVVSSHAINQAMRPQMPYDALRDFAPVCLIGRWVIALVAHPSVDAADFGSWLAQARDAPRPWHYGSLGVGSATHLAGVLLARLSGVRLSHVPFNGSASLYPTLLTGELRTAFVTLDSALPHLHSGRLRLLALAEPQRHAEWPEAQAIVEAVPGFEVSGFVGVVAPARTPESIVGTIDRAIEGALAEPGLTAGMTRRGMVLAPADAEAFRRFVAREVARYAALARQSGLTLE
jgi:tripartite-type tricarboxylate transporter receptor subunit TctC